MALKFAVAAQHRPFDLVAPRFVQLRERFESVTDIGYYDELAAAPQRQAGRTRWGSGALSVSGDGRFCTLFRSNTGQAAPFTTVVVDVDSFAGSQGPEDTVLTGLVKDDGNYLMAWYNRAKRRAGIDLVADGAVHTLGTAEAEVAAPCRLAFSLTGTSAAALADDGAGFRPLLRTKIADHLDMRRPATLAEYHNGFGVRASSGTLTVTQVEAGYFGQTGVRDPHVVTHADGTPYIRDGKVYFTLTQAGLGFFETAHCGVWTLDLAGYRTEQVGNLFFRRDGADAVLGDHAVHVVLDEHGERWLVATSTWGDFSGQHVQVNQTSLPASTDMLHGVHVLDTAPLPLPVEDLPSEAVGQWDPHLVHLDNRWYVSFVNARAFFDFYPALARSEPGWDLAGFSLVGADAGKNQTEGAVLQRVGGRWYVLASNGDRSPAPIRQQYPVYDLSMKQVGTLPAPHPTNIPWPMVFPVPVSDDRTRWLMVTFEGTGYHPETLGYGTHGDLLVLEAEPVTRGQEFAARSS